MVVETFLDGVSGKLEAEGEGWFDAHIHQKTKRKGEKEFSRREGCAY